METNQTPFLAHIRFKGVTRESTETVSPVALHRSLIVMNLGLEDRQAESLCTLTLLHSPWAGLFAGKSPSLAPSAGLRSWSWSPIGMLVLVRSICAARWDKDLLSMLIISTVHVIMCFRH